MLAFGYLCLAGVFICLEVVCAAAANEQDERTIRSMVDQAIARLNKGDVTAFEDFWEDHADYAGR